MRLGIFIAALTLLAATVSAAPHRVTLLGVSGVGGSAFAKALEESLSELYDLVPADSYRARATELGRSTAAPEDVRAVCAAISSNALIGGAVTGRGHARVLVMAVRDGATGEVVARLNYNLAQRSLPVLHDRVLTDLVKALEHVKMVVPDAEVAEEVKRAPAAKGRASEEKDERTAQPLGLEVERRAEPARGRVVGVRVGVGISLLTRYLSFSSPSAPAYGGGTIAGVRTEGAVFPLALSRELQEEHPILASFGVVGSYEHAFELSSAIRNVQSSAQVSRWSVALVGRIPLGRGAYAGALIPETGFSQLSFSSASPVDVGVPNVEYSLVDLGLGFEQPVFKRIVLVGARVAYLALVDAGDIGARTQYGANTGGGLDAEASLSIAPLRWLWISVSARYTLIDLSFAGAGARFTSSAQDQWLGGALEVGFAL